MNSDSVVLSDLWMVKSVAKRHMPEVTLDKVELDKLKSAEQDNDG